MSFFGLRRAILALASIGLATSACSETIGDPGDASVDAPSKSDARSENDALTQDHSITGDAPSADGGAVDVTSDRVSTDGSLADVATSDAPDATSDASDASDAQNCPVSPIWNGDSAAFTLANVPVVPTFVPPDAECRADQFVYDFDVSQRRLSLFGCANFRRLARDVVVDSSTAAKIVATLDAMRTACPTSCRMGFAVETLTVRNGSGCVQQSYDTNNGCAPGIPPNVAMDDIASLHALLDGALGCQADGGVVDGGACTTTQDAGGSLCKMIHRDADAGNDAASDSHGDAPSDARADGLTSDALTDSDGSTCEIAPAWRDFSHFWLRSVSFLTQPPPPGGCSGAEEIYELSLQTKTLRQSGCILARPTARRIDLNDTQIDEIVARLSTIRTTCTTTCGTADTQGAFSFSDCNGTTLASFTGNAESPCGLPPPGPWVTTDAVFDLARFFSSFVSRACQANADAGSTAACAPRCRELVR